MLWPGNMKKSRNFCRLSNSCRRKEMYDLSDFLIMVFVMVRLYLRTDADRLTSKRSMISQIIFRRVELFHFPALSVDDSNIIAEGISVLAETLHLDVIHAPKLLVNLPRILVQTGSHGFLPELLFLHATADGIGGNAHDLTSLLSQIPARQTGRTGQFRRRRWHQSARSQRSHRSSRLRHSCPRLFPATA